MKNYLIWLNSKYFELLQTLSLEDKWRLLDAIMQYKSEVKLDWILNVYFNLIKSDLIEFENNQSCYVYYIKFFNSNESFIKIWIANDYKWRISKICSYWYNYEEIKVKKYSSKIDALDIEKKEHKKYNKFSYSPNIQFIWNTECFTLDILKYINTQDCKSEIINN